MFNSSKTPAELAFWEERLDAGDLLSAIRAYPEQAASVFGYIPAMQSDVFRLGMILAARRILAESSSGSSSDFAVKIPTNRLRALRDSLKPEDRASLDDLLRPEHQQLLAQEWARKTIKAATGTDPSN